MKYINNSFTIEKVKAQNLAKKFNTPIYCYSYKRLKENINDFKNNFKSFSPLVCFAIKANTNVNLIREIRKLGFGADVVSIGEMMKALKAGINPQKIVFSGVGKTYAEISYAIDQKICAFIDKPLSFEAFEEVFKKESAERIAELDENFEISECFFEEADEILSELEPHILSLEEDPQNDETINSIFRLIHTLKGGSGVLEIELITNPTFRIVAHFEGDDRPVTFQGTGIAVGGTPLGVALDVPHDLAPTPESPLILLSSDLGGTLPHGIRVGMIENLSGGEDGLFKSGNVILDPKLNQVQEVTILVPR